MKTEEPVVLESPFMDQELDLPEPRQIEPGVEWVSSHRPQTIKANLNKTGVVFAVLLGGCHVVWSLLVLAGSAQPMMDFIFWAHMIEPVYKVRPFDPLAALTLVLLTAAIGYVFGFIAGAVWNRLHRGEIEP